MIGEVLTYSQFRKQLMHSDIMIQSNVQHKFKGKKSSREITTALFLLRCLEVGLSLSDLDLLTIGMVLDIWTEKGNDGEKYETQAEIREANQHDFDVFENEKSRQTVGLAGSFLFDACLNDVLYIAPAVKDTDDFDTSFVVINQIINSEIVYREKAHPHGGPWFPVYGCMSFGEKVKRADGFPNPVNLAFGIFRGELLESNIGIDGP